jgi:NAD+ kinase
MEKKIGMLVNTQKKGALDMANRLVQWGKKKGIVFLFPPHEASILGVQATPDDVWKSTIDFAVVIGGDGTFLRASRYILNHSISLYGINLGHLGFLACGKPEEAEADLEQILREEYALQQHRILEGIIWREGRRKHTLYALNDLVLTKGAFARVITIEIRIDNRYFNMLPADGVISSMAMSRREWLTASSRERAVLSLFFLSSSASLLASLLSFFASAPLCSERR